MFLRISFVTIIDIIFFVWIFNVSSSFFFSSSYYYYYYSPSFSLPLFFLISITSSYKVTNKIIVKYSAVKLYDEESLIKKKNNK